MGQVQEAETVSTKLMMISVRVDEDTYGRIATHACECDMTLSDFARYAMLKECRCRRDADE